MGNCTHCFPAINAKPMKYQDGTSITLQSKKWMVQVEEVDRTDLSVRKHRARNTRHIASDASASTYSPAPMPATNPTMPASTHHIEMVGQVPDIATAEEIAHSRRMLDLAIKDKLARKKARTKTSEVHAPQTGIPGTALQDPNIEPYPG